MRSGGCNSGRIGGLRMWAEYSGCMDGMARRVAMVSMHTAPDAAPGTADAGGMNVAILGTALELAARGVAVDLLTRATGDPRVAQLAEGVTLHRLPAGAAEAVGKQQLATVADEFGEAVARLAGRHRARYDLIHAHYWLSGIATLPVAIELGLPFVQSFHTLAAMKNASRAGGADPEDERRLRSETYLASQADATVASSAAEVAALIDLVHAPAERLWVIPPGVDMTLFTPERARSAAVVRSSLGIEPDRPILALAARVQPLKGQDVAIRALAALPAPRPVLVIAGEPTPGEECYLADLESLAVQLGVAGEMRFVGALDRGALADLLAAASITLVPSTSETFGLVALESAASGTPVLATRTTGLEEAVAEGESGLFVSSRDPAEWARVIEALLGDSRMLAALSTTARSHAEGFSWGATATGLLGVYASLWS